MTDFEPSKPAEWVGQERRARPVEYMTVSLDRLSLMIEEEVERRVSKMEDKLVMHMDQKFAQLQRLIADAFPGGDPHGHRAYHELQIKQADGWEKIKAEIISKFLTSGLWIASGWLIYAVWVQFKNEVHK